MKTTPDLTVTGSFSLEAPAHLTVSAMFKSRILPILVVACLVAGCEGMTPTQRGAVTGGALGTGIGMMAGGSFGQVVGAGLIGGAAGAIVGSATSNR